jgi:hypothetical protein
MVTMVTKRVMQLTDTIRVSPRNYQKLYSDCGEGFVARHATNKPAAIQYWHLFTNPFYLMVHNFYVEKAFVV